ncbi:hypothetical protein [Burkholderia pseudomallei]|uniref:hypothetical protein n=1 Tax=Burkholderia pseudomallei TaxID=28450 RepID=UPI004064AE64
MDSNELARYNLTTKQLAALLNVKEQTVRKAYSAKGHYCGLKPLKLPNRFLLWPDDARERLLSGALLADPVEEYVGQLPERAKPRPRASKRRPRLTEVEPTGVA